jgi:hypothetical protein
VIFSVVVNQVVNPARLDIQMRHVSSTKKSEKKKENLAVLAIFVRTHVWGVFFTMLLVGLGGDPVSV